MPAMIPRYNSSGLIVSYGSGLKEQEEAQLKLDQARKYAVPSTPPPAIPGYGGSNPVAPTVAPVSAGAMPSLPSFNLGSQFNYGAPQTNTGTAAGIGGVFATPNIGTPPVQPISTQTDSTATGSFQLPQIPSYAAPSPDISEQTAQSLKNIGSGLRGELSNDVIAQLQQRGAERGISVGSGSPNAGAAFLRALGLNSLDLQNTAEKNLQPYQDRAQSITLANISQSGENFRAILDAQQAMQRLQVSESGQGQRLESQQRADLQRQLVSGQQALQQLAAKGHLDLALALVNATAEQQQTILKGAQAMQQLELSNSGQGARLDATLAADLQKQVLAGQQQLEQIKEGGNQTRMNTQLAGNIAGQNALDAIIAKYSGASALIDKGNRMAVNTANYANDLIQD